MRLPVMPAEQINLTNILNGYTGAMLAPFFAIRLNDKAHVHNRSLSSHKYLKGVQNITWGKKKKKKIAITFKNTEVKSQIMSEIIILSPPQTAHM